MALQVIGSGFGRTGTMSMKHALEQLGFPCYHMVECLPRGPSHWTLWEETHRGRPQWDAIFDGFAATVDFPASTSFVACKALSRRQGDSHGARSREVVCLDAEHDFWRGVDAFSADQ